MGLSSENLTLPSPGIKPEATRSSKQRISISNCILVSILDLLAQSWGTSSQERSAALEGTVGSDWDSLWSRQCTQL